MAVSEAWVMPMPSEYKTQIRNDDPDVRGCTQNLLGYLFSHPDKFPALTSALFAACVDAVFWKTQCPDLEIIGTGTGITALDNTRIMQRVLKETALGAWAQAVEQAQAVVFGTRRSPPVFSGTGTGTETTAPSISIPAPAPGRDVRKWSANHVWNRLKAWGADDLADRLLVRAVNGEQLIRLFKKARDFLNGVDTDTDTDMSRDDAVAITTVCQYMADLNFVLPAGPWVRKMDL
jgi:hypothetical protein